jgi:hypothetical protein
LAQRLPAIPTLKASSRCCSPPSATRMFVALPVACERGDAPAAVGISVLPRCSRVPLSTIPPCSVAAWHGDAAGRRALLAATTPTLTQP